MNAAMPQQKPTVKPRRAVVLVAVLVVVVILSLAGYQYSDAMLSEYKASEQTHRAVQARAFAHSGVLYTAAMLSSQNNLNNTLAGNPWNNPQYFQAQPVLDENNQTVGYFSIIAPSDPAGGSQTDFLYGVLDEGGKINLNALMNIDPTGQALYNMLIVLPNMTDVIAYSIVSWMGGSYGQTNGGAQNDYYTSLTPPYQCRNGPIDSIDELLLVQGVTRDLLYGADANRNGTLDPNEQTATTAGVTNSSSNSFNRGWSAFLTVHSREQNYDPTGNAFIYLNNTDLSQLQASLSDTDLSLEMVNFIIMYRQYGAYSASSGKQSTVSTVLSVLGMSPAPSANTPKVVQGDLSSYSVLPINKAATAKFASIFDLVNVKVGVAGKDPQGNAITTVYQSPLNDAGTQRDQLPKLFAVATLYDPTKITEMPPRININTAPFEVLSTLPGLAVTDVENILATRPPLATPDATNVIFQTPTWLLTEAQISKTSLQALDKLITTRTQVFRVQAVGYFEGNKGPVIRVEAIVDANSGRPRIIAWRNLTELGKGWNGTPP